MKAEALLDVAMPRSASPSRWRAYGRQFLQNGLGMFGAAISLLITAIALVAPLIAPYDPIQVNPDKIFEARSWSHWLGTDELGRDLFSRLIYGARISFFIGIVAVVFKTIVGTAVGLVTGYFEGAVDHVLMRLLDVLYAFPRTLLAHRARRRAFRQAKRIRRRGPFPGFHQLAHLVALSSAQRVGADPDPFQFEPGARHHRGGKLELSRFGRGPDAADLGRDAARRRSLSAPLSPSGDFSRTAYHVGSLGI
ncbi:MAG: ABC transporter permease [Deltaproteobacteria bacterium]|nr:ABC transporter permease [Deltaproteobacteria bacterium]